MDGSSWSQVYRFPSNYDGNNVVRRHVFDTIAVGRYLRLRHTTNRHVSISIFQLRCASTTVYVADGAVLECTDPMCMLDLNAPTADAFVRGVVRGSVISTQLMAALVEGTVTATARGHAPAQGPGAPARAVGPSPPLETDVWYIAGAGAGHAGRVGLLLDIGKLYAHIA